MGLTWRATSGATRGGRATVLRTVGNTCIASKLNAPLVQWLNAGSIAWGTLIRVRASATARWNGTDEVTAYQAKPVVPDAIATSRCRDGQGSRVRVRVRVRVRGGGLLPTTSHSMFCSRVGQIAIFSHCQP